MRGMARNRGMERRVRSAARMFRVSPVETLEACWRLNDMAFIANLRVRSNTPDIM